MIWGSTKLYQLTTGMELISGEEEFVNKTLNDENVEISTAYTREGSERSSFTPFDDAIGNR